MKDAKAEYINNFFKEAKKNIKDLKNIKTAYKQIPNILTFSRAIAPILINILFFSGNVPGALVVCGLTFITDAFDGIIARKLNVQSQFGADLDAICDKILIAGISLPIVILNPFMLINVILEVLISITNVKAKLEYKKPKSSFIGKLKTWVLSLTILSGYVTSLLNINLNLLKSILMIITLTSFQTITYIEYLKKNKSNVNNENNSNIEIEKNNVIDIKEDKDKDKVLEKEVTKTYSLADYQKLKNDLLYGEKNKDKTKTKTRF